MKKLLNYLGSMPRKMKIEAGIAMGLTIAATVSIPVLAWFSGQKKMGDLERVDTPTRLYITAAHDDVKYLQLTDIRVNESVGKKQYYVFCVSGKSASYYNLQLAYTTNNQFEYFVYPAHQLTAQEVANNTPYLAKHIAHDENGEETDAYYYNIETNASLVVPADNTPYTDSERYRMWSEITGSETEGHMKIRDQFITTRYLNQSTNPLIADNSMHNQTYSYKQYDDANANNEALPAEKQGVGAQLYGEPIYWQTLKIPTEMDADNTFADYYILEINWSKAALAAGELGLQDDKETDIIYIAAQAASST